MYQVLWGKYLQLFLGAGSYAHAVVLATFMGGLALGNALFGRLADRRIGKLALYAGLELGIGFSCLLFPALFDALSNLYLALASADPESLGNLVVKFIFSIVAMLLPTVLMGGTLPVLSKFVIRKMADVGHKVGWLYFINSVGAVAGCVLAGFWLIATFGLELSMVGTAAINLLIGAAFLYLRRFESGPDSTPAADAEPPKDGLETLRTYTDGQIKGVVALITLSGMVSMMYEVVWTRLLSLVMGASAYSFSVMLMTFIGGISIGGVLVSMIMRKDRNALLLLALCELGIFASLLLMLPVYERLPYYFNGLASLLSRTPSAFALYQVSKVATCFLIMAVPTILIGMTLPLASRICVRGLSILGAGVGSVFSFNTMGNLVGAALGGLVLVPALGLQMTMEVGILLSGLIGAGLLFFLDEWPRKWSVAGLVAVVLIAGLFMAFGPRWSESVFNFGGYRHRDKLGNTFDEFKERAAEFEIVFHRDGPNASVVVTRSREDHDNLFLKVNGKSDAGTGIDMRTQLLLGHTPMLLHPDPKDALVIGLGSGVTVDAVLKHPVERCDVVEISPAVVEASHLFDRFNGRPLEDARTRLAVADAKEFLHLQADVRYDAIISEPSNPWIAGIGNLFSVEFFEEAARHLKPGGLMVQWVQLYEIDDRILSVVFNTFSSVFTHVTVWHPRATDIIMVGSMSPQTPSWQLLAEKLARPSVHGNLNQPRVLEKMEDVLSFLATQMMSSESFKKAYPGEGVLNSDFFPFLEYEAPRAFFIGASLQEVLAKDERLRPRRGNKLFVAEWLGNRALGADECAGLVLNFARELSELTAPLRVNLAEECRRENDPRSHDLYRQFGNRAIIGQRKTWGDKISNNSMSGNDWLGLRAFEGKVLLSTTTVFGFAETARFEMAHGKCLELFPERSTQLEQDRVDLYRRLGLGPVPAATLLQ